MMIKAQQFNSLFIIILFLIIGCNNSIQEHTNKRDLDKIIDLIKQYDAKIDIKLFNEGQGYEVADSLYVLLKKISPKEIIEDTVYLKIFGDLLEKKYLAVRELSSNKEAFFVYNCSIWCSQRECTQFMLNVMLKMDCEGEVSEYVNKSTDFYCVETLVTLLGRFSLNTDNHLKCQKLLKEDKMGACIW